MQVASSAQESSLQLATAAERTPCMYKIQREAAPMEDQASDDTTSVRKSAIRITIHQVGLSILALKSLQA